MSRDPAQRIADALEAIEQIRGFRNILVHQYFGVDVEIVRDVVQGHLPRLAEALRSHATAG